MSSAPYPELIRRLPYSPGQTRDGEDLAATWQQVRTLSHYRPDYAYQLGRYEYAETYTTDPHYVVLEVAIMPNNSGHSRRVEILTAGVNILLAPWGGKRHVQREGLFKGIPGVLFAAPRHTGSVEPDVAVWPFPWDGDRTSYDYLTDGVPLLVMEVVSHSDQETSDNDWVKKFFTYAQVGIREYWLWDHTQDPPLQGFALEAADGDTEQSPAYRLLDADSAGGQYSRVLDATLRAHNDDLQCWDRSTGQWIRVLEIPLRAREAQGEAKERQRALLEAVATYGRFTADETTMYAERVRNMLVERLPSAIHVTALLLQSPADQRFAVAWRALEGDLDVPPGGH